jgi:hypothetical protein
LTTSEETTTATTTTFPGHVQSRLGKSLKFKLKKSRGSLVS